MDPLSVVIRQSKPKSIIVGATDVGGDISIRFPAHYGAYFYSVAWGNCWLHVEGDPTFIHLGPGDCVVLPSGRPFILASEIGLATTDAAVVFQGRPNGLISTFNGGGRCMMFAAHFEFDGEFSRFLLGALDAVVRINDLEAKLALRNTIEQMIGELQQDGPGSEMIVEHLAHIALIKVLRFHLSEVAHARPGWLYALADRQISLAIAAIHETPAKRWTVALLATVSAMSRTSFAIRFKAKVGMTPLEYLIKLRMLMASKSLLEPGARVSVIAHDLGYDSESAFNTAFKREMGLPPRRFAESARRGLPT